MFPRCEAATGFAAEPALLVAAPVFGFADSFGMLVCLGAEIRFFNFVFFADFLADFLAAFFATGLFFAAFLDVFLACFTARVLFFARFFAAAALAGRVRGDLRALFALRFLTVFFLAFATTKFLYRLNRDVGVIAERSA
jgi:hypothetical protein